MRRILFAILLPGAPDYLVGDIEEEAQTKSGFWLLRHVILAAVHNANLLETAAASAFLIGIPLLIAIQLRRFVLTLIPFRESAEFSIFSLTVLTLATATLCAWQVRLLNRRWLPVLIATGLTIAITALTNAPIILTVAAFLGGSLATLRTRGNIA